MEYFVLLVQVVVTWLSSWPICEFVWVEESEIRIEQV